MYVEVLAKHQHLSLGGLGTATGEVSSSVPFLAKRSNVSKRLQWVNYFRRLALHPASHVHFIAALFPFKKKIMQEWPMLKNIRFHSGSILADFRIWTYTWQLSFILHSHNKYKMTHKLGVKQHGINLAQSSIFLFIWNYFTFSSQIYTHAASD